MHNFTDAVGKIKWIIRMASNEPVIFNANWLCLVRKIQNRERRCSTIVNRHHEILLMNFKFDEKLMNMQFFFPLSPRYNQRYRNSTQLLSAANEFFITFLRKLHLPKEQFLEDSVVYDFVSGRVFFSHYKFHTWSNEIKNELILKTRSIFC